MNAVLDCMLLVLALKVELCSLSQESDGG